MAAPPDATPEPSPYTAGRYNTAAPLLQTTIVVLPAAVPFLGSVAVAVEVAGAAAAPSHAAGATLAAIAAAASDEAVPTEAEAREPVVRTRGLAMAEAGATPNAFNPAANTEVVLKTEDDTSDDEEEG